jgi:hypothetical protein
LIGELKNEKPSVDVLSRVSCFLEASQGKDLLHHSPRFVLSVGSLSLSPSEMVGKTERTKPRQLKYQIVHGMWEMVSFNST